MRIRWSGSLISMRAILCSPRGWLTRWRRTPSPASAAGSPTTQGAKPGRYAELVRAVAGFLRRPDGPQVAVFDTTGWDTHANEGGAEGPLAGRLAALAPGLAAL